MLELRPFDKFFFFFTSSLYNLAILASILDVEDLFWLVFALSLNEIDPNFFLFFSLLVSDEMY